MTVRPILSSIGKYPPPDCIRIRRGQREREQRIIVQGEDQLNQLLSQIEFSGIVTVRDRLLQLENPLRLESGEPSFDTPLHIKEAMARAMTDNATHYAPSTGIAPLKQAVVRKIARRNGISHIENPNDVLIVNGGMHGLYCVFQALLEPGDEVIIPRPNWTATAWIIRLSGGEPTFCDLRPELGYRWDVEELEQSITPRTRAILINSPHNPTGGLMRRGDLERVLEIAEKHGLWIIADEAYEDIVYDDEHVSIAGIAADRPKEVRDRIVSCFTFSKSYAMTGWRLGYVVSSSAQLYDRIKKLILYTINGVSTPTQYAGIAALDGPQDEVHEMCREYQKRRDLLFDGVNKTPFLTCQIPPSGAFYLYAQITEEWEGSEWDLVNYLIDRFALGSVPGEVFYDRHKAIRFSYACSTEMIEEAINRLASVGLSV